MVMSLTCNWKMLILSQALMLAVVFIGRAETIVMENVFISLETDDIDLATMGVRVAAESHHDCVSECFLSGPLCVAYNFSSNLGCYLMNRGASTGTNWKEKATGWVNVMVRQDYQHPNCTAATFPYQRGRSRYRFQETSSTWSQAASHCRSLDSKLVQFTTTQERLFVYNNLVKGKTTWHPFVGLKLSGGRWIWDESNDVLALSGVWSPGEPSGGGEYLVHMYYTNGLLNDVSNTHPSYFICVCLIL